MIICQEEWVTQIKPKCFLMEKIKSNSYQKKRTWETEYNSDVVILADGRKVTPFVILKRKHLLQEKNTSGSTFKCNEKEWMTELVVEWLREFWDRRQVMYKLGLMVLIAVKSHNIESEQSMYRSVQIAVGMASQLQVLRQTCWQYGEWLLSGIYH